MRSIFFLLTSNLYNVSMKSYLVHSPRLQRKDIKKSFGKLTAEMGLPSRRGVNRHFTFFIKQILRSKAGSTNTAARWTYQLPQEQICWSRYVAERVKICCISIYFDQERLLFNENAQNSKKYIYKLNIIEKINLSWQRTTSRFAWS